MFRKRRFWAPVAAVAALLVAAVYYVHSGGLSSQNVSYASAWQVEGPVSSHLTPSAAFAPNDKPSSHADGCHLDFGESAFGKCVYGDTDSSNTVFLVGDGHASQWLPALQDLATRGDLRIVALTKAACPPTSADLPAVEGNGTYEECTSTHESILSRVASEKPGLVILSSYVRKADMKDSPGISGAGAFVEALLAAGAGRVAYLGDTPHPGGSAPECIAKHDGDTTYCSPVIGDAVNREALAVLKAEVEAAGGTYIETWDLLCGHEVCPVVIGDVLMYRDDSNLTATGAEALSPLLADLVGF